jgi:hypothetical protein
MKTIERYKLYIKILKGGNKERIKSCFTLEKNRLRDRLWRYNRIRINIWILWLGIRFDYLLARYLIRRWLFSRFLGQ